MRSKPGGGKQPTLQTVLPTMPSMPVGRGGREERKLKRPTYRLVSAGHGRASGSSWRRGAIRDVFGRVRAPELLGARTDEAGLMLGQQDNGRKKKADLLTGQCAGASFREPW